MSEADESAFRMYAVSRSPALRRTAYLMCGDWHQADDLVQTALTKLFVAWKRVRSDEHPDAYARRILTRCSLDERRRPWRRESPADELNDRAAVGPSLDDAFDLHEALSR